jgi:hypothetical protein
MVLMKPKISLVLKIFLKPTVAEGKSKIETQIILFH